MHHLLQPASTVESNLPRIQTQNFEDSLKSPRSEQETSFEQLKYSVLHKAILWVKIRIEISFFYRINSAKIIIIHHKCGKSMGISLNHRFWEGEKIFFAYL